MMFTKTVKEIFSFLQSDFECSVSTIEDVYQTKVVYQNETTATIISFEPRESHVFVLLSRLIDGNIPPYPIFIKAETALNMFYLDDLINLRSPSWKIQQSDNITEQNLERILTEYAKALKTYGQDVLNGDFTVFSDLEEIVKKRALQAE